MTDLVTRPWPFSLDTLRAGEVAWHAYQTKYGQRAANPYSEGRYALPHPHGEKAAAAAFYIARSPTGALWETLLNNADPDPDGTITIPESVLGAWSLARLELTRDVPNVLCVSRAWRLRFVHPDDAADQTWAHLCSSAPHGMTQQAAAEMRGYLAEDDRRIELAGVGWPSRQWERDLVHVLYDPPVTSDCWAVCSALELNSDDGRVYLQCAVTEPGYTLDTVPDDAPSPDAA